MKRQVYIYDPTSLDPMLRWGVDLFKMERRAFKLYDKDYNKASIVFPEFKRSYDKRNNDKT